MAHYHSLTHVLCFLLFNLWLLPFGFFISLSINESTLPDRQAQGADEVYSDGGARTKQKSGIISAFGFVKQQREEMMPSLAKKV